MSKKSDTRTWTVAQVASQERELEFKVSEAQRELDRVKKWHQAALRDLRKFRKAKVTHAAQIVSGPSLSRPNHGGGNE